MVEFPRLNLNDKTPTLTHYHHPQHRLLPLSLTAAPIPMAAPTLFPTPAHLPVGRRFRCAMLLTQ